MLLRKRWTLLIDPVKCSEKSTSRRRYCKNQDGFIHHHNVRLPTILDISPKSLPALSSLIQMAPFRTSLGIRATLCTAATEKPKKIHAHEDLGLPSILTRNARTRGQFKPKHASKGTSSYQLRQFAEATLGSGSLRKAVKLPEGEDLGEWLAVNSKENTASARGID